MEGKSRNIGAHLCAKEGEIVLYQPDDTVRLEVKLEENTVWLSQAQICLLFGKVKSTISYHIANIFKEGELDRQVAVRKIRTTTCHGAIKGKTQEDELTLYNLDVIISVGYRVHSIQGTKFRIWATQVLKEHLLKGYSINHHLVALQQHVDCRFETLEQRVDNQEQQVAFLVDMHKRPAEGIFASGCVWDAWTFTSSLVRDASQRIILIDNYVDERTLLLLDKRKKDVTGTVYTRANRKIELDLAKHNEQNNPIELIALQQKVHDRYLIIDSKVWLLGASVKDMGNGLCTVIELGFAPEEVLEKVGRGGR